MPQAKSISPLAGDISGMITLAASGYIPVLIDRGPEINHARNKGIVVLIEPDASVRDALVFLLQSEGWVVNSLDGHEGLAVAIGDENVVAVVSEASLPDCTPEDILEQCKKSGLFVIFTGHDMSLQGAVDLIRQGACDFLDKPFPQRGLVDLLNELSTRQND